jgi:hypothetical protein
MTSYSEVLVAFIISLVMEAICTPETSMNFCETIGAIFQKAVIFILISVKTLNLCNLQFVSNGLVWYGMVWYGMVWYGMVWWYSEEK